MSTILQYKIKVKKKTNAHLLGLEILSVKEGSREGAMTGNSWAERVRTGLAEEVKVKWVSLSFTTYAGREDLQSRAPAS